MAIKSANIQLNSILGRIKNKVKEAHSEKLLKEFGNEIAEIVINRTREGNGVAKMFGRISKLAKLKKSTILSRERFKGLDPSTSPSTSNLTRTGDMLRSIRAFYLNGSIEIRPSRDRNGRNEKLARYAHQGSKNRQPRIFMNLSKTEFDQVMKLYRQKFGRLLKK